MGQLSLFDDDTFSEAEVSLPNKAIADMFDEALAKRSIVDHLMDEFMFVTQFIVLSQGRKAKDRYMSLLFNPHRLDVAAKKHKSFSSALKGSALARLALSGCHRLKNESIISYANTYGCNGSAVVADFPPTVAREIYHGAIARKILDPCAGWGGRMIGAASLPNTYYHGFEPSTETYKGLNKLGEYLMRLNPSFRFRVEHAPFEDAGQLDSDYDIAFTSPPYYDTEKYSNETTQACHRYEDFDVFTNRFLYVMLDKCLESSRLTVINVGDRVYNMSAALKARYAMREYTYARLSTRDNTGKGEKFYVVDGVKEMNNASSTK